MSDYTNRHSVNQSDLLSRIVRAVILIVVSLVASIAFVSFAVHHMRLQFEGEYKGIADTRIQNVCDVVKMSVNGDDIVNDKIAAAEKYKNVLNLMLADTHGDSETVDSYVLFAYTDGSLVMLLSDGSDSPNNFVSGTTDISDWLNADNSPSVVKGDMYESVIVPVADSTGRCVGIFEYKVSYSNLDSLGDKLESRILSSVIIAVVAGVVLFAVQIILPRVLKASKKGGQHL